MKDFELAGSGSIYLLFAKSEAAEDWIKENLPADAQRFGYAVAIESRYVPAIVAGIGEANLTIERSQE